MEHDLEQLASKLQTASTRTPQIVLDAFLPPECALPPLTFRAWLALERIGSPAAHGAPCTPSDYLAAIAIFLDPPAALTAWQQGRLDEHATSLLSSQHADPSLLLVGIQQRLREAFAPVPRDLPDDHDSCPPGVGWCLALLEWMMAEYGLPPEAALDTPLAIAFCLRAAAAERHGAPLAGPSFTERTVLDALTDPAASSATASSPKSD